MAVSHFFLFCLPRFLCFLVFSSASSLFPFISFFYLPPHLCPCPPFLHNLPTIFSSCLLQISFFTSRFLSLFHYISAAFHYISLYVSLLLSILYVLYSTISLVFFLLHPFFILFLVFHTFSFCSLNSSTIYLSCIFPCLCLYISSLLTILWCLMGPPPPPPRLYSALFE
jgi:hypothetical protein